MHLSLQQKEQFFHEMRELLRSGQSVPQALELKTKARMGAMRGVAEAMMNRAGPQANAEAYFAAVPEVFGEMDREIIRGGEAGGRLDDAMGYLSDYYGVLAKTRRRIIGQSAYPMFLLHFGALLLGVPRLMSGGLEAFVWFVACFLGVFYVLAALMWFGFNALMRLVREVPRADRILQSFPAIGGARVALVGSRFCMLMSILVKASGSIFSAMTRSAAASGSALFQRGAGQAVLAVQGGEALGAAVMRTGAFPEDIDRAFQVGEVSGRLDEEMQRQAERYTELFQSRLEILSGGFSKFIYLAVAGALAYQIISFWMGYFGQINSLL